MLDVLVVGAGPAGVAAGIEARRLGPRRPRGRQGHASRATRPAATASPPARCACSTQLGLRRPHAARRTSPVTETVLVVARPAARSRCRCPPTASTPAWCPAPSSTPRSSTHARRRGRRGPRGRRPSPRIDDRDGDARRRRRSTTAPTSRARCVVAADGHYSAVRRLLGAESTTPDLGTWHAFRQYFRGVDDRRLWVLFEARPPPRLRVGVPGGRRARQRRLRRAARVRACRRQGSSPRSGATLLERPSVRDGARAATPSPRRTHRAWPIPAVVRPTRSPTGACCSSATPPASSTR